MSKTHSRSHKPYKGRHGARARTSWRKLGTRKERRTGVVSKVYHRRGRPQGVSKGRIREDLTEEC